MGKSWCEATYEALISMWADGLTSTEIARRLSLKPEYVRVIIRRSRADGDERATIRQPGRISHKATAMSPAKVRAKWAAIAAENAAEARQ